MGLPLRSIARDAGVSDASIRKSLLNPRPTMQYRHAQALKGVSHKPNERQEFVLAIGAVRRLQALRMIAWSCDALAAETGLRDDYINQLTNRPPVLLPYGMWKLIHDLYERLSGTPGPSERGRTFASRYAWGAPLDWEAEGLDIDDPRVMWEPALDPPPPPAPTIRELSAQRRAEVARLTEKGLSAAEIAEQIGISQRQVVRLRSPSTSAA
ncbi:helix-turn-helix domain-containing protein [Nocardia abscessus]|uniref:helix-turn-helix domain-containing protein n=1 Tax=Nocardia abscessus TaxID=120957 RepID=UPI002457BB69|nr:helix-turn-helix domain-containing protein [Nocardia abscessus]